MRNVIIFSLLIFAVVACQKIEPLEDEAYFIFGTYNGYCQSNCTQLFKVQDGEVYEDEMDTFLPGQTLLFRSTALPQEKYDLAYTAYEKIPETLLDTMDDSFGCPGCVDQDIIFLEYFDGEETQNWQLDTDLDALPSDLRTYASDLIDLVNELQK